MIDREKVLEEIKTTLINSFQKAIGNIFVRIIGAIFIIIVLLLLMLVWGVMAMLLTYEVAVIWLFIAVIFSAIPISLLYRRKTEQYDALVKNQESQLEKKVQLIDCEITGEEYLFSWGDVPGNDSDKLLKFLSDNLGMGWAENAEVLKLDDSKTIHVCKDENSAEVIIDATKEKATLKSSDGSMYDLKLKKECGKLNLYRDGSRDNPKITMIQRFANMSELQLKLSKVELRMKDKDGDIEIDTFVYDPPSHTMDFGSKIKASEDGVFSPLNLDCWINCETTKLRQVIPDYPGKVIKIDVYGKIQFVVGTTKIDKVIEAEKSIKFKSKREQIVS